MSEFKWPTEAENPEFVRFARQVADWVTVAVNSGKKVGRDDYCPIGCAPGMLSMRPTTSEAASRCGFARWQLFDFMCGFDGHEIGHKADIPYYQLGVAYRRRFAT